MSLSLPDYNGWIALSEKHSFEIIRAYGGLSAIEIPAGERILWLHFTPIELYSLARCESRHMDRIGIFRIGCNFSEIKSMQSANELQVWIAQLDRRMYAVGVGLTIGILGTSIGLMIALLGPWLTIAAIVGVLAGLYVITDVNVALYTIIATLILVPFGTFPVKIAITPTLLDLAMGGFLLVYLFQWMTGRRQQFRLTPIHVLIAFYMMWLILTFALGLRYAMPTSANIRQFSETLLSIGMVFILSDLLRNPQMLRRLIFVILLAISAQALISIGPLCRTR